LGRLPPIGVRRRSSVLIALAILAIGACGESGLASQPEDGQPYGEPAETPLRHLLGGDPTATTERFRRQAQRQQELIATCMARQGFEYVPVEPPRASPSGAASKDPLTRRQYVERYGFGISTKLSAPTPPSGSATTTTLDDPNPNIFSRLSPTAREAYDRALYGQPPATGGCQGEAVASLASRAVDPVVSQVEPQLARLYERVNDEPGLLAAQRGYGTCMSKAGHPAVHQPQDALDLVSDRLAQARIGTEGPASDKSVRYDAQLLAETQRFELRLAKDDYRCGLPLERVRLAVQRMLEQHFIDENRDLLERYRAALAGGG
jgi:hypothetical protein